MHGHLGLGPLIIRQEVPTQQSGSAGGSILIDLIANPFAASFRENAFWASLGASLGVTLLLALAFSLIRPRHSLVYAPKIKHSDSKHAPPPIEKGLFSWLSPIIRTKEEDLVDKIGLDATIFLRFTRMLRNFFLALSVIGILITIPVNVTKSDQSLKGKVNTFSLLTPQFIYGEAWWSHVVCSWAIDLILVYLLWRNYRKVRQLRRSYFESPDYQMSLHARTLMITDLSSAMRSDEGILRVTDDVNPTGLLPRASVGRNVKLLPKLIEEHEDGVRRLESVLAKYLKKPDNLPSKRPTMRPPRKSRGERPQGHVDAIEYLTNRIRELEQEIRDIRERIDKRDAKSYGFASWEQIETAHLVAFSAQGKHPNGTTIVLAPRPSDLIWENLSLSKAARGRKKLANIAWVTILTLLWTPINACIAIFLSDLSNLGRVWPAFQTSLNGNSGTWAIVQGIASPAITSTVYLVLPIIFRRLSIRAGDTSKTSRERHVVHHLYAFFCFNNLIVFSLFSAVWAFISATINATNAGDSVWDAIERGELYENILLSLCTVSPFWATWLLQRSLGAAVDLAQLLNLFTIWFARTFMSPTPRQNIEWTAPPPFNYASYYNYFLFYATIALCFATLQPIVLPITAFYFALDSWLKKYLLMYVFVTKTESGGQMWRVLYNRMIFAAILANIIIAMVVKARGTWTMVGAMAPLPILMLAFKYYCMKTYDNDIHFYARTGMQDGEALVGGSKAKKVGERTLSKFGHPALTRRLMTPMIHARARHVLGQVYRGRLNSDGEGRNLEYSDIALQPMSTQDPGRPMPGSWRNIAPFEMVPEGQQDFSYFKDHADFRSKFSEGLYGRPEDLISERSQTPRSFMGSGNHGHGSWTPDSTSRASTPINSPNHVRLESLGTDDGSNNNNNNNNGIRDNRNIAAVDNDGIVRPVPRKPLSYGGKSSIPLILRDGGRSTSQSPNLDPAAAALSSSSPYQPSYYGQHRRSASSRGSFEPFDDDDNNPSSRPGPSIYYANPVAQESQTRLLLEGDHTGFGGGGGSQATPSSATFPFPAGPKTKPPSDERSNRRTARSP